MYRFFCGRVSITPRYILTSRVAGSCGDSVFNFLRNCRLCVFISLLRYISYIGLFGGLVVKNLPASAGDADSIPESGRSPGEGDGYPTSFLA